MLRKQLTLIRRVFLLPARRAEEIVGSIRGAAPATLPSNRFAGRANQIVCAFGAYVQTGHFFLDSTHDAALFQSILKGHQ
jgi:hypothetical protein